MGEELIALKDHANLLTNKMEVLFLAEDGLAIQQNITRLDAFKTVDAAKQGRLSAAR